MVLNVATSKKTEGKGFYGLAIGFTVVCAAFAGGGISGGAFNPAVGTALTVSGYEGFADLWLYWVWPLVGGALAAPVVAFPCARDRRTLVAGPVDRSGPSVP